MADFEYLINKELSDEQKGILATMMAKMAVCDGHVDPFEVDFLGSFLQPHFGNELEEALRNLPPLEDDKVASQGKGAEQTLYLFCSLLSCVDEHVDEKEENLLQHYGQVLGIDEATQRDLNSLARQQVLQQCARAMTSVPGPLEEKLKAVTTVGKRLKARPEDMEQAKMVFQSPGQDE